MGLLFTLFFLSRFIVVTSTYDLAYLVKELAGGNVDVSWLVDEVQENPYDFRPQMHHILKLSQASLFVHTGTFERVWLDEVLVAARNPKILEDKIGHLNISDYVKLTGGSACFILDIELLNEVASILSNALKIVTGFDPEYYDSRLKKFIERVSKSHEIAKGKLGGISGAEFVAYSRCSGYLAKTLDVKIDLFIERESGRKPSDARVRDITSLAKLRGIGYVITPSNLDPQHEFLIFAGGLRAVRLPHHISNVGPNNNYPNLMSSVVSNMLRNINLEKLKKVEK